MFHSCAAIAFLLASQILPATSLTVPRTLSPRINGCDKPIPQGQSIGGVYNISIESDDIERSYLLFIPPTYDPSTPTPLILSYHGGLRTAIEQLELDESTLR